MRTPAALCLVTLFAVIASAQDAPDASKAVLPSIQFQVLKGWKTDLGDHSIYLNRVAPPILKAPPVQVQQVNPQISEAAAAKIVGSQKRFEILFFSATVYDHKFSEIRWEDNQRQWKAMSNTDFNLLCGATFETKDAVYTLLPLGLFNKTTSADGTNVKDAAIADPDPQQRSLMNKLSTNKAQYVVAPVVSGATPRQKDLEALDALHVYYDANRQTLADAYAKREVARIAEEQKPKQPQKPKDTIVNFWPGNGTVIIDGKSKGVNR